MNELRLYLRRDSLRDNDKCDWTVRADDGRIVASGSKLDDLPQWHRCHLVLAGDLVSILPARLPDLPMRKLAPLLAGAAEAHALGDADQLHVAWLGKDEDGTSWLAAVDRPWLEYSLARLDERGIRVDAILPETMLLPLAAGAWSLLQQENGTLLRVSAFCGLVCDPGDPPAGLLLALNDEDAVRVNRPLRLHLYQGTAPKTANAELWQAGCGLPVDAKGTWSWREPAWPEGANLLQGAMQPRHGAANLGYLLRPVVAGGLLLLLVQGIGMSIDWALLAAEERSLQTDMRRLAEKALPAHAAIVDPAWQVSVQLKTLQASGGNDDGGMLSLLGQVGRLRPPEGGGELRGVGYEAGRLSLEYAHAEAAWLDRFADQLRSAGLSTTVTAGKADEAVLAIDRSPVQAAKEVVRDR